MKKLSGLHIISLIVAVCVAGYFFLVQTVMPKYIQEMLPVAETMAQDYINGSVKIGGLTWNGGLSAEIDNVVVKDVAGRNVAVLPKSKVHLRPWLALIKPERALSRVELIAPEVWLRLDEKNKWNMTSLMKPSDSEETPFYGLLEVENGKLNVVTPYGEWLLGTNCSINGGANPNFEIVSELKSDEQIFKVNGLMDTKGVGKLQLNTEKFSLGKYAPLLKHYTTIEAMAGDILNTHIMWDNNGKQVLLSGAMSFSELSGTVKVDEEEQHSFVLDGNLKLKESILDLEKLDARIDNENTFSLHAKADIHDLDNIGGQGLLTSPKLTYKSYCVEKLNLPFTLSKKLVQVDKASFLYGNGEVLPSFTLDLRDNTLTADIKLNHVSHRMSIKDGDVIHANGALAVVGCMEEQDGKKNYNIHVGADTCDLAWKDLNINKLALDGDYSDNKLTIDHFSAQTGDGILVLKGTAELDKEGALALDGRMSDFAIDPFLYHFSDVAGKGLLSMNFKVCGTVAKPEFGTMAQLREVDVMDVKLQELHGFIGMKDNVLSIKRLGATLTQGRHLIDGTIDFNPAEPALNLDVNSKQVRVEPLVALVNKDYSITGNLNNFMHISGTVQHPRVQGNLELTDGSVQTHLINGVSGKYLYDDGFISLQDILINLFVAQVQLAGTVSKDKQLDFALSAQNIDVSKSPYKSPDFDIQGLFAIDGQIKGNLDNPTFVGNVAAEKILVNGEAYTEIAGNVDSNLKAKNFFDISFKQPHQNAQGKRMDGEGTFKAQGNLDMVQKYLQGDIKIANGDINGLLRTDKLDYALNGNINGNVTISPQGKGSGILFKLDSDNIDIHKLHYENFITEGALKKGVLTLQNALLQESKKTSDKGLITANGFVNFFKKTMDIKAEAVKANPAIVNIAMKNPLAIKGDMNLKAALSGSFDSPKGMAEVNIAEGSFMDVAFDDAKLRVDLENDIINVKDFFAAKDVYSFSGKGLVPMDALRTKAERKNPDAQMDVALDFDNTRLGILTASKYVEWATGDMKGKLVISGTLDEPLINGSLKVEDGTIKLKDVGSIFEQVDFAADFSGSRMDLHQAKAKVGEKGLLTVEGHYDYNEAEENTYKFAVKAEDAIFSYSNMFKGKINGDIEIVPQAYRDYWHTLVKIGPNSVMKKGVRPLIRGNVRLDDVLGNVWTVADSEVGSETNLGLDLNVELGPKIHMENAMFYDLWLSGGMKLKGGYYSQTSGNEAEDEKVIGRHNRGPDGLRIDGKIRADKGSVTYLRTDFKITDAELSWPVAGEILPRVKFDSWARFAKYKIYLRLDGDLSDVKNEEMLKLTSTPPLEKNTLVRMLTLQRDSANSGKDLNNEDLNNVMSVGLQMAVLGNVEFWVKQALGLDRFRVYSGKINAGLSFDGTDIKKELTTEEKNRYNVLISKYLTDKFMLGYTTSFDNEESVIFGQYDLGPHFNITYSEKEKRNSNSSKGKHWIGLEYSVDFN